MNSQVLIAGLFTILGAIIGGGFGLLQAHFQNKNQVLLTRAIDVENKRPRFIISTLDLPINSVNFDAPSILLYKQYSLEDAVKISNINTEPPKIFVKNISNNYLYQIDISITYHFDNCSKNYHNLFEFRGLDKKQSIILLPDNFHKYDQRNIFYDSLIIKFLTTAGEIGYVKCDKIDKAGEIGPEDYYYVKRQNKLVTPQEIGTMIDPKDDYLNTLEGLITVGGENVNVQDTNDETYYFPIGTTSAKS